jgi:hypothetical protein
MELSYAATNTDGGVIAFVVTFVSIIFLGGLSFTIFMLRMIRKSPPKLAEPSAEIYISWGERQFLGVKSGTEPNLVARVRALRARQRHIRPIAATISFIMGVIFTIFSAIVLIIVLSGFIFPQSLLARIIVLNWALLPYVFIPLFILLGVPGLAWMIIVFRLLGAKDIAPIRLKNGTEKILKVFVRGAFISEVQPGTEVENKKVPSIYNDYVIKANDESGNLFYFKEFNLDELDALDWKVTIEGESHNP